MSALIVEHMPVKWGWAAAAVAAVALLAAVPAREFASGGNLQVTAASPATGAPATFGGPSQAALASGQPGSAGQANSAAQAGSPVSAVSPALASGGPGAGDAPGTASPAGSTAGTDQDQSVPASAGGGAPDASPVPVAPVSGGGETSTAPQTSPSAARSSAPPSFTLGWFPHSGWFSAAAINALPARPQIVNYYSAWLAPFNEAAAQRARSDGIETFVEMEPWHCPQCQGGSPSLTDIASGTYDGYLTSFGQQIAAYGYPVMVTFAHEMNGNWYPWGRDGQDKVTPAQWVAAWDHVVTVVSAAAPGLVDWVWAPNDEQAAGAGSVAPYWPGDKYVDTVGIDGYLRTDSATYQAIFGRTVADIRALTSRPIWIAETGLNVDATTAARLTSYVAAVRAAGIQGLLYFDTGGWTLTDADEEALAAAINSPAG